MEKKQVIRQLYQNKILNFVAISIGINWVNRSPCQLLCVCFTVGQFRLGMRKKVIHIPNNSYFCFSNIFLKSSTYICESPYFVCGGNPSSLFDHLKTHLNL